MGCGESGGGVRTRGDSGEGGNGLFAGQGFIEVEEAEADRAEGRVFTHIETGFLRSGTHRNGFLGCRFIFGEEGALAVEHAAQRVQFIGGRGASDDSPKRVGEALVRLIGRFQTARGEDASCFVPGGVIEGGEGVEGGVGSAGADFACLAGGGVKHVCGADGASPEGVKASSVEVGAG